MTAPIRARSQAAALCVLCGLQLGCRDKVFEQRFYSGDVTATNLVGYWVVSEDSVNLLKKYGYREHLKRSDHVMLAKKQKRIHLRQDSTDKSRARGKRCRTHSIVLRVRLRPEKAGK